MRKQNDGNAPSCLVPKYIGSDFDHVVNVSENMDAVIGCDQHSDDIKFLKPYVGKISTVADNIDDVETVAENIHEVVDVHNNMDAIQITSGISNQIHKVADNMTSVNTVSDNIEDIKLVADKLYEMTDPMMAALLKGEGYNVVGSTTEKSWVHKADDMIIHNTCMYKYLGSLPHQVTVDNFVLSDFARVSLPIQVLNLIKEYADQYTLPKVFGGVLDLINGLVITPVNNQYPKLAAFNAIYELEDHHQTITVKSFVETVDGNCEITLQDDSTRIAYRVDAMTLYRQLRSQGWFPRLNMKIGDRLNIGDTLVVINSVTYALAEKLSGVVIAINTTNYPYSITTDKTIYLLDTQHTQPDLRNSVCPESFWCGKTDNDFSCMGAYINWSRGNGINQINLTDGATYNFTNRSPFFFKNSKAISIIGKNPNATTLKFTQPCSVFSNDPAMPEEEGIIVAGMKVELPTSEGANVFDFKNVSNNIQLMNIRTKGGNRIYKLRNAYRLYASNIFSEDGVVGFDIKGTGADASNVAYLMTFINQTFRRFSSHGQMDFDNNNHTAVVEFIAGDFEFSSGLPLYLRGANLNIGGYIEYNAHSNQVAFAELVDSYLNVHSSTWFNYKGITETCYLFKTDRVNSVNLADGIQWQLPDNVGLIHPDSAKSAYVKGVQGRDPSNVANNGGLLIGGGVGAEYVVRDEAFTKTNTQATIHSKDCPANTLTNIVKITVVDNVASEYYSIPFTVKLYKNNGFIEYSGVLGCLQNGATFVDKITSTTDIDYNAGATKPSLISSTSANNIYLQVQTDIYDFKCRVELGEISCSNIFRVKDITKL